MQSQTKPSGDSEPSFTASDCDGLDLGTAIQKFVFDPNAKELGEVVGAFRTDGWIWVRARNFDPESYMDGFGDEAQAMFGHTCSPIYEDGSVVVPPSEVDEILQTGIGTYKFDRISRSPLHNDPQDFLRVLANLARHIDVYLTNLCATTNSNVDIVWPIDLSEDLLAHTIKYWGELANTPPSFDAVRSVAKKINRAWQLLFGYIARGELGLVGAAIGVKGYQRQQLMLTKKHLVDIWTGVVITRERGFEGIIRETQWHDVLLVKREFFSVINSKAHSGLAESKSPAQIVNLAPRSVGFLERERKNKGGRPATIGNDIYAEIIRIADLDGLPSRAELMRVLMDRFPDAAESHIRSILANVYKNR